MKSLGFHDHCVIRRKTHEIDRFDNPIGEREIYDGCCDFQPGGQTALSIVTSNDRVYLPGVVKARVNDFIRVEPKLDEPREGIVEVKNVLELKTFGDVVTEIEIRRSTEKYPD